MAVTWTKQETFTGSRTQVMTDPENPDQEISTTVDCRDILVEFREGTITHSRHVNVCYDEDGNYDETATDIRIGEVANGIQGKIDAGVISAPSE